MCKCVASFPGSSPAFSHTVHKMGREPGRSHNVHDDVLCVVLCVVLVTELCLWPGKEDMQ